MYTLFVTSSNCPFSDLLGNHCPQLGSFFETTTFPNTTWETTMPRAMNKIQWLTAKSCSVAPWAADLLSTTKHPSLNHSSNSRKAAPMAVSELRMTTCSFLLCFTLSCSLLWSVRRNLCQTNRQMCQLLLPAKVTNIASAARSGTASLSRNVSVAPRNLPRSQSI